MRILVSACLMGKNCKYNGGNNESVSLRKYVQGHDVYEVCPEVMGGLSIPRIPCEIKNGIVMNKEGVSCDKEFRLGAHKALNIALKEEIDLAILQSRSPSCGLKYIYDGTFSGTLTEGNGIFAQELIEHGFTVMDVEEL